jgi:hypothetical protein
MTAISNNKKVRKPRVPKTEVAQKVAAAVEELNASMVPTTLEETREVVEPSNEINVTTSSRRAGQSSPSKAETSFHERTHQTPQENETALNQSINNATQAVNDIATTSQAEMVARSEYEALVEEGAPQEELNRSRKALELATEIRENAEEIGEIVVQNLQIECLEILENPDENTQEAVTTAAVIHQQVIPDNSKLKTIELRQ